MLTFLLAEAALIAGALFFKNYMPRWIFPYTLALWVAYVVGASMVRRRGLATQDGQPAARSWNRSKLTVGLGLALFLMLITFSLVNVSRRVELADVNAEIQEEVLGLFPSRPPQGPNVALLYYQAYQDLKGEGSLPAWLEWSFEPDNCLMTEEVRDFLNHKRTVLDMLYRTAEVPSCFFPFDAPSLLESLIFYYAGYDVLARFLALEAQVKALSGDLPAAMEDLAVVWAMANHLRSRPTSNGFYASAEVVQAGFKGLEHVLAHSSPAKEMFPLPVKSTPSTRQYLQDSLRCEEAITVESLVRKVEVSIGFDLCVELPPLLWRVFMLPSELTYITDSFRKIRDISSKPYYENRHEVKDLETSFEKSPKLLWLNHYFSDFFYFDWEYLKRMELLDARYRLMALALAATAYRASNGTYPVRAEDLLPDYLAEIPIDPFDGKPLKLKTLPGGLDLYSVRSEDINRAIHFYLGRDLYEEKRVKPAREEFEKNRAGKSAVSH